MSDTPIEQIDDESEEAGAQVEALDADQAMEAVDATIEGEPEESEDEADDSEADEDEADENEDEEGEDEAQPDEAAA
jgi:hypothetical protein